MSDPTGLRARAIWRVGDPVRYARHRPDKPNVQRLNDDGNIGRAGFVTEVDDGRCYGAVAYLVRWGEPHPDGSLGMWCVAEQLDASPDQGGGAPAGLRAAIAERVSAEVSHTNAFNAYMRSDGDDDRRINAAERRDKDARLAIDAALAHLDARLAMRSQRRPWDYLGRHSACLDCGTTERPHKAHGRCHRCAMRERRARKRALAA